MTTTFASAPASPSPVSGPTTINVQEPLSAPAKPERLLSLDVLRGLTIAGMILVNNPGSWSASYGPLKHAPWHGCTPTDLVFPWFLFMVGVAMTLSFDKRVARGASRALLFGHVIARSSVLILLGWMLSSFPNFRLMTPFILMIAGLQLVTRDPNVQTPLLKHLGWTALGAGLVWWIADFRYFNGPTQRSTFEHLWPTEPGGRPLRIPGVLQRIGLCYLFASAIALNTRVIGRIIWGSGLMLAYWAIMVFFNAPASYIIGNATQGAKADAPADVSFRGALSDWIDVRLLGEHLYSARPDPEGLLSTIPAIATVLIGTIIGTWILRKDVTGGRKCLGLLIGGIALTALGMLWALWFPLNKKIWTSSYVLYTGGLASMALAFCYYLCDVLKWRWWAIPFVILGTNAIVAFFGSGIMGRLLSMIKFEADGKETSLKPFLYSFYESGFTDPKNASLAWALSYVSVWVLLVAPLYWKKIFVRV